MDQSQTHAPSLIQLPSNIPAEVHKQIHSHAPNVAKIYVEVFAGDGSFFFRIRMPGDPTPDAEEGVRSLRVPHEVPSTMREAIGLSVKAPQEISKMWRSSYVHTRIDTGKLVADQIESLEIKFKASPISIAHYSMDPQPNWDWAEPICKAYATRLINEDLGRECYQAIAVRPSPVRARDRMRGYHNQAFTVTLVNAGDCASHETLRTLA